MAHMRAGEAATHVLRTAAKHAGDDTENCSLEAEVWQADVHAAVEAIYKVKQNIDRRLKTSQEALRKEMGIWEPMRPYEVQAVGRAGPTVLGWRMTGMRWNARAPLLGRRRAMRGKAMAAALKEGHEGQGQGGVCSVKAAGEKDARRAPCT